MTKHSHHLLSGFVLRHSFVSSRRTLVMLGEAKHLRLSSLGDGLNTKDQRLKAWPRGLHPLRCSFASLRVTLPSLFRHSTIRHSFVIRHSCFVIAFALGMG